MGCIGDKTVLFFATDSGNKGLYCIKITTISVQYYFYTFLYFYSVLLTVPPPSRQIYTRRPCWGGERKERVKVYYKTLFLNYSFHLDYILDLENENRPPFWQIVLHFKPECSTVHHKLLYFYLTIGWLLNVIQYIYISH